jgi:hypothetical protein
MLCRAKSLVLLAFGLIDDAKADQRLVSEAPEEAERFEAPCDKAGHICCRVVGRVAIPLPRFKGKTTPLPASYRRHRMGKARAQIPLPIEHRNCCPSTMLSLRFSLYHLNFNS